MKILVTGATGYVGGRLVRLLLEEGHDVRVLVRDPTRVLGRSWHPHVEVMTGDLLEPETLPPALEGVDAAYYLVHSMGGHGDFVDRDRHAARNFALAAKDVKHVIYLGGLLPDAPDVSDHLRSRAEVGWILRAYCHTTEFRAGPIIGSGSASFEMVRYLTERLPVMVAPKWILNDVQPIAIRDILSYLVAALDKPPLGIVDVGTTPLTFKEMMEQYAACRGLTRVIMPVPVLAPALAARWVGLVTPISNDLAVPLVEGVVHPVVGDTSRAHAEFPEIEPISYRKAVTLALARIQERDVETRWTGALGSDETYQLSDERGLIREIRSMRTNLPPAAVFASFSGIGGERGWLTWEWAWAVRGIMDQFVGGPGLRRGRRHPQELLTGEAVDFWRVEKVEPPHILRLRAEMKVPGRAWLQWEAFPEEGGTRLVQTAMFEPTGFFGVLYWYALFPVHKFIFSALMHAIERDAQLYARGMELEHDARIRSDL
ncbi:MAG: DUF2867 domain-containing protein [Caldilineaceae bacterium]